LPTATALSAIGALLATTGLCVDAWLHALNPALLAQEGLVSANPGHLLLGGGLALMVLGVLILLLWVHASRRTFGLGGMLVMTSLFAAATLLLGIGTLGDEHSHSTQAATDHHGIPTQASTGGDTGHQDRAGDHHGIPGQTSPGGDPGHQNGADQHSSTTVDVLTATPQELQVAQWMIRLRRTNLEQTIAELKTKANDPQYAVSGHTIAHSLGRLAYATAQSPKVFAQCNEVFQSGCYHGVLEAHFDANPNDQATALALECRTLSGTDNSAPARQAECLHGLGHGLVGKYKHALKPAVEECHTLASNWERQSCYSGAYMENAIHAYNAAYAGQGKDLGLSHHGADHVKALVPSKEHPYAPCDTAAPDQQSMCWSYLPNMYHMVMGMNDFSKLFPYCNAAPEQWRIACMMSVGKDVAGSRPADPLFANTVCKKASGKMQEACYVGAATNQLAQTWTIGGATKTCASAPTGSQMGCYRQLTTAMGTYYRTPQALRQACQSFGKASKDCLKWVGQSPDNTAASTKL